MRQRNVVSSALVAILLSIMISLTVHNSEKVEDASDISINSSDQSSRTSVHENIMMPMSSSKSIFGGIQNALQIGMNYTKDNDIREELQEESKEDPPLVLKNVDSDCKDKGAFKFLVNEKERDCAWIGQNPEKRMKHCDKIEDGIKVKKKCKFSCDNCKTKNKEEKIDPIVSQSATEGACADIPGKHFPQNKKKRNCQKEFIKKGEEKFLKLCTNKQYYKINCPKTCNTCVECQDDSTFRFQFWSQERDCAWLSKSEKNIIACEKKSSVKQNCRKTCDNCETDTPTFSPTTLYNDPPQVCTDDSTFSLNGETCASIRADRQSSCQDDRVRRFCPTTVGFIYIIDRKLCALRSITLTQHYQYSLDFIITVWSML